MRCVSFEIDGRHRYGLMDGNAVFAVRSGFAARYPDLRAAVAGDALAELGDSVEGQEHWQVLFAIGVVLFAITFVVNLIADIIVRGIRSEKTG